jgi:hypothetical protein
MQMDASDVQFQNAASSIRESLEQDSNATNERDWHSPKHFGPSFSTEAGMQIDESDTH